MHFGRRRALGALGSLGAALCAPPAWSASAPSLEEVDLELPGERKLARRCLLLVPRNQTPTRLLVLYHGLGETSSELLGIRAWADPYGLLTAYDRLLQPPVARVARAQYFTDQHLDVINAGLSQRAFAGLAVACPFTPNVYKAPSAALALDRYADWTADVLLPELRKRLALPEGVSSIGLDGVSLGGYVSLEVFLRRPEAFGAVGCVQGAFGVALAEQYARKLHATFERLGPRPLRIATSREDPFRAGAERLVQRLRQPTPKQVTFSLTPGPHSQLWLREVATVDLLYYYDRLLTAPG